MKKYGWLMILTALVLVSGSIGAVHAEIIPPCEPGQQIGYPAVVLCEKLTLREAPDSSANAVQTLKYGDLPIAVGADLPEGEKTENGFVYCTLGDSEDSACGWVNADYIFINPAWYVTEENTPVYAWNDETAPRVALLDNGTRLPILKEEGSWYLVSLRGAAGWIHSGRSSEGIQTHEVASDIYTQEDIASAIDTIRREFDSHWKGCTLTEIYYGGDELTASHQDWAERNNADEVIVLLSSFDVDSTGGIDGSFNPDSTYSGWSWILVRTDGKEWKHVDHGY